VRILHVVRLSRAWFAATLAGSVLLCAGETRAEVTLAEAKGFKFFTDGRVNTFASLGFGDEFPTATPNPDGGPPHSPVGETALYAQGQNSDQDDAKGKYFAVRGRNGFLGTVLALGMRKNVTDTTTVKGYVALWGHAETFNRDRTNFSDFDVREGYMAFEGPWGNLTAGRALGLFGRMSTDIDFNYGHNFGLGYPCGDAQGPTCGHIGTGVMFPGFAAGFQYSTPSLAGLKLHAGLYDPVRLLGAWNRAAIARPEAALSFETKFSNNGMVKVQAEGMIQPLSRLEQKDVNGVSTKTLRSENVWGVAGGGRFEYGPVRFGASAFRGKGLGQYYALQNSPVVFSPASYNIRSFTGLYAQGALVFGAVQVSAGAGRVSVDLLPDDKKDATLSNAKSQTGISAAVYYSISDSLVLGLDYFRFQADWHGAPRSGVDAMGATVILPGFLKPERQVVSYINAGATFHW
jgi:hypothetical protein